MFPIFFPIKVYEVLKFGVERPEIVSVPWKPSLIICAFCVSFLADQYPLGEGIFKFLASTPKRAYFYEIFKIVLCLKILIFASEGQGQ